MSTARSSTEDARPFADAARAVADVVPLLAFRTAGLRGRSRWLATVAFAVIVLGSVLAGWLPAYLPDVDGRRGDILLLLPSMFMGVLVVASISAVASGGGRELLPREQAVAYPVSATTDHLGALVMAPLNIAWLLQAWALLGGTAYVVGPTPTLLAAQVPVLLWLASATALAQVVAWANEWVRRGRYGVLVSRAAMGLAAAVLAALVVTGALVPALNHSPTRRLIYAIGHGAAGNWLPYAGWIAVLLLLLGTAVVTGAAVAGAVVRRPPRDETRAEASTRPPRENPTSDFGALVRTDRAGIWRSVPLRRGLIVLATLPGLVALAGALEWESITILPGLVASGGALLFGVNSWSLDGRGALWRDSLPVPPRMVFASRVYVLVEVLLVATWLTLLLASLRAGSPSVSQVTAVLCASVVVSVEVVASALRWSVRRPFSVDLRSARATPAPPLVMVGYSTRLALATTLTGLLFTVTARISWDASLLVALPFLLVSLVKLMRSADEWARPETRSRVIATVAS